jgi:hypothetical protein
VTGPDRQELDARSKRELLRQDLVNRLCSVQWTGGGDSAYHSLREHMHLIVHALMPVIEWTDAGTICRCPFGPAQPHERADECRRG